MKKEKPEDRIPAVLAKGPATMAQLRGVLGGSIGTVSLAIKRLDTKIHISGWAPGAHTAAIYSLGRGVTPPHPSRALRDAVLDALPATRQELMSRLGISKTTVSNIIEELDGCMYISGWDQSAAKPGHIPAIYSRGQGITPPKPGWFATHKNAIANIRRAARVPVESTVARAMRTQPVSVFSLARTMGCAA